MVASGFVAPTAFAFLPDGRILVTEQAGVVRLVSEGVVVTEPFLDLRERVNDFDDRGLLAVAPDPGFAINGEVYLLYVYDYDGASPESARVARVSRFTAAGNAAQLETETIILGKQGATTCDLLPRGADCLPADFESHTGGAIEFAADGSLFVSTGEGAPNRDFSHAWRAQDLDYLGGKVLHVAADGQGLPTNPFWNGDPSANRSKIWAYGLRNPFRMTLSSIEGQPLVGDVGSTAWEELNLVPRGANLGWPCYEGNRPTPEFQHERLCRRMYERVESGEAVVQWPLHAIGHHLANAIVGGTFYTAMNYPAEYRGAYFFGDAVRGFISTLRLNEKGEPIEGPRSFGTAMEGPVAIEVGPDGNLYYLSIYGGELRRIRYIGAPQAERTETHFGESRNAAIQTDP